MGARVRRFNPDLTIPNYVELCLDCGSWRLRSNAERDDGKPPWVLPKWVRPQSSGTVDTSSEVQ